MISQYEVPAYMVNTMPEIKQELTACSSTLNIFKSIQCLANYTRKKVLEHDLLMVKKCFSLAEMIYAQGNSIVKNAMENVYVFSFSSIMNTCDRQERKRIQAMMPLGLHTVYVQQVLKPGI